MIWGHDTDEESEQLVAPRHPPPPPPPLSSGTSAPEAEWSLIASRGGELGLASQQQQLSPPPSINTADTSGLDHAISIPALQKYDDNGEVINKEKDADGGGSGSDSGKAGWWSSWLGT
jgi:hypothetical protein